MIFSCKSQHLTDAEKIFNHSLEGKVEYIEEDENWNDFNGNGYRTEVYSILDLKYINEKCKEEGFKLFNFKNIDNPLNNTEYSEFLQNGAGFYKTLWLEDEIKTVVVDTLNNKFIYYHSMM